MIKLLQILVLLFLSFLARKSYAQYENVWAFGSETGLDFNNIINGLPSLIHTSQYAESGVSICDINGQLLFYSCGGKVWDKNHSVMPNGDNLMPEIPQGGGMAFDPPRSVASSSWMGGAIIPIPNGCNRYYVFGVVARTGLDGPLDNSDGGKLYYSIVDMSLNNGLGDVDANNAYILVDTGLTEHVVAIPGNNCDYWILSTTQAFGYIPPLLHSFKAYHVTEEGVSPVPQTSLSMEQPLMPFNEPYYRYLSRGIKTSFDYKKIAIDFGHMSGDDAGFGAGFRLFDFDRNTGIVSNELQVFDDTLCDATNLCFSPDDTKVYLVARSTASNDGLNDRYILQYDITSNDAVTIRDSKVVLQKLVATRGAGMKVGPDERLYIAPCDGDGLVSVIPYPNITGIGCGFWKDTISSASGKNSFELPNHILLHPTSDTIATKQDIQSMCFSSILTPIDTTAQCYMWENGYAGIVREVDVDGVYWVSYIRNCIYHVDTFYVNVVEVDINVEGSCVNYPSGRAWIESPNHNINNYGFIWMDGTMDTVGMGSDITNMPGGDYWLFIYSEACSGLFPLQIPELVDSTRFSHIAPIDTVIHYGQEVQIITESDAVRWLWDPIAYLDDTQSSHPLCRPEESIVYRVIGFGPKGCSDTGWVKVGVDYTSNIRVPSAFSPNGDGLNDEFRVYLYQYEKLLTFQVFNRWGEQVFESRSINQGWKGDHNGETCPIGTYFYYIEVLLPGPHGRIEVLKGDVALVR